MKRLLLAPLMSLTAALLLVAGCAQKQVRTDLQTPTAGPQSGKAGSPSASASGSGGPNSAPGSSALAAPESKPASQPPPGTAALELAPQKPAPAGRLSGETSAGLRRIHFDFDQAVLSVEARTILTENGEFLKRNPERKVRLEGHCDERGTAEYNIALGERRAKSAFQFLADLGVDRGRMTVVSFGEESPLDPAHNESAWAKNRRAEFVEGSR